MTKIEKKLFEITVWYRYMIYGEQEKEFETHEIEATDVQDAVNKASDLYKNSKVIPFQFLYEKEKYSPTNFSKSLLFNLTAPHYEFQ